MHAVVERVGGVTRRAALLGFVAECRINEQVLAARTPEVCNAFRGDPRDLRPVVVPGRGRDAGRGFRLSRVEARRAHV